MQYFCCRCCRHFTTLTDNVDVCPLCRSPFIHVRETGGAGSDGTSFSSISMNDYVGDEQSFQNVLQRLFESSTSNKVRGLKMEEIDDLPRIICGCNTFDGDFDGDDSNTQIIGAECPICQESFKAGEEIISLESVCTHKFHASCLIIWLTKTASCPVCRKELV